MLYDRNDSTSDYHLKVKSIARSMLAGKCMFFLGAGASVGLPKASQLSSEMAEECKLEWHEYIPLSTIAFYYESIFTRDGLNQFIVDRINRPDIPISGTIRKFMAVLRVLEVNLQPGQPPIFTITTNYDQQFETAYREEFHAAPEIIIYKGAHDPYDNSRLNWTPNGPLPQPPNFWLPGPKTKSVLYKMHGCISQPEMKGLVITEEDYINFLANALREHDPEKTLLNYIKGELLQRTIIFIGYSLSDWNFRAIFKGVEKDRELRSYAVQLRNAASPLLRLQDKAMIFWHDKKVDILNADGESFMDDLLQVFQAAGVSNRAEAQHAG